MLKIKLGYGTLSHIRTLLEKSPLDEETHKKFAEAWSKSYLFGSPSINLAELEVERIKALLEEHISSISTTNTMRTASRKALAKLESGLRDSTG